MVKKEVVKEKKVSWFRKHWILTVAILLIFFVFIFYGIGRGSTPDENVTSIIEKIPAVQTFLSENQNAMIKTVFLDQSTDNEKLELIREDCGEQIDEVPDHYVTITKDNQEIKIYLNGNGDRVLCWVSYGIDSTSQTGNENGSLSTLNPVGIQTASEKQNGYTIQDCYDICDGLATVSQRNNCKHSNADKSCDLYGQPGVILDNFVNGKKKSIEIQNQAASNTAQNQQNTESGYSIQDCYNACDGYATVRQREDCKHYMSDKSCDLYGVPGIVLDNFVNGVKNSVEIQNKNAAGIIPVYSPNDPQCPAPNTSSGDYGVPTGC